MNNRTSEPHSMIDWKTFLQMGEGILGITEAAQLVIFIQEKLKRLLSCNVELYLKTNQWIKAKPASALVRHALRYQKVATASQQNLPKLYRKKTGNSKPGSMELFSNLAFPLKFQDEVLGVLRLERSGDTGFLSSEIDDISLLSNHLAFYLAANHNFHQQHNQTSSVRLLHNINQFAINNSNLDDLAQFVAENTLATFKYLYAAVLTTSANENNVDLRGSSLAEWLENMSDMDCILHSQFLNEVLQGRKEVIVQNKKNGCQCDIHKMALAQAFMPIISHGRIEGVLLVFSGNELGFDDLELDALRVIAAFFAAVVEAENASQQNMERSNQLISISQISSSITSILEETELLEKAVNALFTELGYPFVQIFTVHTGRKKVFFSAGKSRISLPVHETGFAYDLEDENEVISIVAKWGVVSWHENNYADYSRIVLPLKFAEQTIGVLEICDNLEKIFSPEEKFMLESLVDYIAVALHNAALYKSEKWRRKVAESMREIAGLLTATADLNQVLQYILHELEETLPIDIAAIWLIDTTYSDKNENQPFLNLAAVHLSESYKTLAAESENRFSSEEIMQYCQESSLPSPWLLQILENNETQIRSIDDPYEPLGAILDFQTDYSAIAAPLRVGNDAIGLLSLAHHTNGRYGHEAQNMTATFASYAAVAIENTRLYEAAHDQAWISTVLLQVAEATQSLNSLDELLGTMAQLTPNLIGMNSCSIFLWDDFRELFVPTKSHGLDASQESMFQNWWISLGDVPFVDQLYFSKNPVYVNPEENPIEHPMSAEIQNALNYPAQIIVVFPMITRGDILGFFMVTYQEGAESQAGKGKKEIDWDEKYAIIQGITQQTAVVVENLQLLKAQQEEAYVSVALLQVAQAVVSLNALAETLETIVRLTPILIGVRRCVIFLWNDSTSCFYLSASYGLSRNDIDEMGDEFLEHEFPILDSIRNTNQLLIHQVNSVTENALSWQFLEENECFLIPIENPNPAASDPAETFAPNLGDEHLRSTGSLMFGFPLSVKGKFLGVMLTQEMNPSTTYFQGRTKRHEISIGIAQQLAMAIHNDMLQHEVLERERLEREFQLAREIQETFLPDRLPEIQGWDIKALWQPARQVSGDFYDIFELPNHQLGIVIADVADKGMAAALFMTLIRTLLRAAVREMESPAAVLQRVNDLLLPDTKHGMFVTVMYCVIEMETGIIRYANAGHNPPILINGKSREFRKLTRTGIALGIFEGIEMEENSVTLECGDSLLLYTDGITEAFSEDEEMFGEPRFIDFTIAHSTEELSTLLDNILATVTEFIGGSNYTDDITLVGIRRYW